MKLFNSLLLPFFVLILMNPAFADSDEILPYDEAYKFSAKAKNANTINASWTIADKHLMYKEKFKFTTDTPGIELGQPQMPNGVKKEGVRPDGTLGPVDVFTRQLNMTIPVKRTDPSVTEFTLTAHSQGCNDRICYPPNKQFAVISLAKADNSTRDKGLQAIKDLGRSLGLNNSAGNTMMTAEQAFRFSTEIVDNKTIIARWRVAEGTYLYKKNFKFTSSNPAVSIGEIKFPKADKKDDPIFGEVEAYHSDVVLKIPLISSTAMTPDTSIQVEYQGCSETLGICYPPEKKTVFFAQSAINSHAAATASSVDLSAFIGYVLLAFVIGLGLTFTPCVLPMIPILSSIIIGQSGEQITKTKGGILALIYVLGTSVVYTIAGWVAGVSGNQLQAYFQAPWVIATFAGLLFLLSLSMFGLYTIQMPSFIQSRMQNSSSSLKGGTYIGVFIMGVLSSLIVGACASPLLLSVLGIAMTTHDPVLGASIMFGMSMGMGVFLVAFGIGASAIVPKAGTWMDTVKYGFGVLLIGVAIYLLQAIPAAPVLYLWSALFIITSIYMGTTQSLPDGASGWRMLWKGVGTVLMIWGILALLGGMLGGRYIMNPIPEEIFTPQPTQYISSNTNANTPSPTANNLFSQVANLAELDAKLAEAKQANKPVVIDFFADWCTDCVRMERTTFKDPVVAKMMRSEFVAIQTDVTDQFNKETKAIMQRYGIFAPPAILFFNSKGELQKDLKLYGYKTTSDFIDLLNKVKAR